MNVEFRKSFEKDLTNLRDEALLQRIKAVIEEVETVDSLSEVRNVKKMKAEGTPNILIGAPLLWTNFKS